MAKLRVGFIGAGGMAEAHLTGLSNPELFPDIEIAAFCDVVLERAQAQAAKYGATGYGSPKTMVAEAGLDACYVLLPPFAHGDAERACIEGGVPFLVEKPIGKDKGLLKELRDEIAAKGLMTAAGYMNRYQPSVQAAKQAFEGDEAILAYGGWLGGPPTSDNEYLNTKLIGQWWVQKDKSGGQMVEQVTHTVDLVRYFLGDAVEVYAHATTAFNKKLPNLFPNYSIDDAMTTTLKFANGGVANIIASASTPVAGKVTSGIFLNIHGMNHSVRFDGWGHDATIAGKEGEAQVVKAHATPFVLEDTAFLNAVKTGDKSGILTDYADAYKTAIITLAANESAETGKPVDVTG